MILNFASIAGTGLSGQGINGHQGVGFHMANGTIGHITGEMGLWDRYTCTMIIIK